MNPRVVVVNSILIAVRLWFLLFWFLVNRGRLDMEIRIPTLMVGWQWLNWLVIWDWFLIRLVGEDWLGIIDSWWRKRLVLRQLQGQCHWLRVVHQGRSVVIVGTCYILDRF